MACSAGTANSERLPSLPADLIARVVSSVQDEDALAACRATCKTWAAALEQSPADLRPLGFPPCQAAFGRVRSLDYGARGHAHSLADDELQAACQLAGSSLEALDISGAFQLTNAGLQAALLRCTHLRRLVCRDVTTTDAGLAAALPKLVRLHTLDLRGCGLLQGSELLPRLQDLQALCSLSLGGCALALHVNQQLAEALAALRQLEHLDLSCNAVDDTTLVLLARLPKLRSLSVAHCHALTDAGLLAFAERGNMSALESLDLTACTGLGDQLWVALEHMVGLKALSLAHLPLLLQHPGMVDAMPAALWRGLPRLQHLCLAGCCCHPSKLKLIAAACGSSLLSLDLGTSEGKLFNLYADSTDNYGSRSASQGWEFGRAGSSSSASAPRLVGQPYRRLSSRHLASICEAAEQLRLLQRLSLAGSRLPLQAVLPFLRASPWLEVLDLSGCCLEQLGPEDSLAGSSSQQLLTSSGVRRRLDFHSAAALMSQHLHAAVSNGSSFADACQPLATAASLSSALACLLRLHTLRLAHCSGLTDRHLSSLGSLTGLTQLSLAGGGRAVRDLLVFELSELPQLRQLDLSSTGITDGGLSALGSCPMLHSLAVGRNRGVTGSGVAAFAAGTVGAGSLRALDLSMVGVVDDAAAAALAAGCPKLRCLLLAGCSGSQSYHLSAQGASQLSALTGLQELSLGRCPEAMTDASLDSLSQHLTLLTRLTLAESQHLTAAGLSVALPRLRCLSLLDLTCCWKLGDEELRQALPGLTKANVQLPQGSPCPTGSPFKRRSSP